jgi:hypothetical protein
VNLGTEENKTIFAGAYYKKDLTKKWRNIVELDGRFTAEVMRLKLASTGTAMPCPYYFARNGWSFNASPID